MRHGLANPFKPLVTILYAGVSVLLVWEAAGRTLQLQPQILPTPSRIILEIWEQAPRLRPHSLITCCEIFGGYLLGVICAVPASIVITLTPGARRASWPLFQLLRPAPLVILTPVFFVWFGFGIRPEVLVVSTLCFVTLTFGMVSGLNSPSRDMLDLLKTMGATRIQNFTKVMLPASLPMTFTAMKAAVPLAVVGATAAEFAQAEMGLGYITLAASFKFETPLVFAGLTLLGLIGIALYAAVVSLQALLIPWHAE